MKEKQEFLAVYEASADAIFRFCFYRVYDRELALDLTQESFVRTWDALCGGKEVDNIRAFVYRVARNLIIDNSRKKKQMSLEELIQDGGFDIVSTTGEDIANNVDCQLLLLSLDKIDSKYREVILMRYIEGLSPREIATILQEKENAVSVRLNRGVKKLREVMGQ